MKQKLPVEPELMKIPPSVPLPLRETVWVGVSGSLEEMERVALFDPKERGENTTWTMQFREGVRVAPVQLSSRLLKSSALAPLNVICRMIRLADPEFPMLRLVVDDSPTCTDPKSREVEETEIRGEGRGED